MRVVSAALQNVSGLRLRQFVHDHDFRYWIDDAALVAPECCQLGVELSGGQKDVGHVVIEQSLALSGGERIRTRFPRHLQILAAREVGDFNRGQAAVENARSEEHTSELQSP